MIASTTRTVCFSAVLLLTCLCLSADELEHPRDTVEDIPAARYKSGTIMPDGKISGGVMGTGDTPIQTSSNLLTNIADLPTLFERPKTRKNIFRKGEWGVVASPHSDYLVTTDGQFEVDVVVPDIGINTLNLKLEENTELSYRVKIDGEQIFKSEFRTFRASRVAYLRWTKISQDLVDALGEGEVLTVTLVDSEEKEMHVDEYSLTGFSANLTAIRKLLKDSPRAEVED